jgi:hypothetical protein
MCDVERCLKLEFAVSFQIRQFGKGPDVKGRPLSTVRRRDLLRLAIAGAGATAVSTMVPEPAAAKPVDLNEKRKARYRADSVEVQDFYRVNSYPAR